MEKRLIDLEIKYSHQDELLNELNKIVTKQQFTIDRLEEEVKVLSEIINNIKESGISLVDEKPPHY